MHEHLGPGIGADAWLHVVVAGLVLSATLFAVRHLLSNWRCLGDRLTPATHAGMGVGMSCMVLAPSVPPAVVGAVMVSTLSVAVCHQALHRWAGSGHGPRQGLDTPALAMMAVMAVMSFRAGRDSSAMTVAMLGCLLACAVAYAVPLARAVDHRGGPRTVEMVSPLALTAGMAGMLAMP